MEERIFTARFIDQLIWFLSWKLTKILHKIMFLVLKNSLESPQIYLLATAWTLMWTCTCSTAHFSGPGLVQTFFYNLCFCCFSMHQLESCKLVLAFYFYEQAMVVWFIKSVLLNFWYIQSVCDTFWWLIRNMMWSLTLHFPTGLGGGS